MNYKYCVYLTVYKGNKLPPFYIGSSNVTKVSDGYRGSVESIRYGKIFKSEVKTNPHLFSARIVSLHETREGALAKERKLQKQLKVIESPLYINLGYAGGNHGISKPGKLNSFFGKKHSEETKEKLRQISKDRMTPKRAAHLVKTRKKPSFWLGHNHTEESKQKMRTKRPTLSATFWCTNGMDNLRLPIGTDIPIGYIRGRHTPWRHGT